MRRSLAFAFASLLLTACTCGGNRLVSSMGGAVRVTLVGADSQAATLQIALTKQGQTRDTSVPIAALPLVTVVDSLEPGVYRARVTAWDARPAALQSIEVTDIGVVVGGLTDITIDLSHNTVWPSEQCNGVDDDGDGEVDEALSLPTCTSCMDGVATVLADDERCGEISCEGLDGFVVQGDESASGVATCVRLHHAPITMDRCLGVGACVAPNNASRCGAPTEQPVARKELCQVLAGCDEGRPSITWSPDGTPCGREQICQGGACVPVHVEVDAGVPDAGFDAGTPGDPIGCSDGTREGFLSLATYPALAACSGGWSVPGVTGAAAPACGRVSGNSSANRDGAGCASADLCSSGWHVCRGKDEVAAASNGSCADAVPPGATNNSLFFAVAQASQSNTTCDTSGDNDVFGCGNLGTQLSPAKNCGVLTRALASTRAGTCGFNEAEPNLGPWQCMGGAQGDLHEGAIVTKQGCPNGSCSYDGNAVGNADKGGVLCCRD